MRENKNRNRDFYWLRQYAWFCDVEEVNRHESGEAHKNTGWNAELRSVCIRVSKNCVKTAKCLRKFGLRMSFFAAYTTGSWLIV